MNTQISLSFLQRSVAFCLAAMVTLSLLGGIDQLAHQPQTSEGWAAHAATAHRA